MKLTDVQDEIEIGRYHGGEGLIYQPWLMSFVGQSTWVKGVKANLVYENHREIIARILRRSDVIALTLKSDPDLVLGWAVVGMHGGEQAIVHYIYVKKVYQKMGAARLLLDYVKRAYHLNHDLPMLTTHRTHQGIERLKGFDILYNPYLLWSGLHENPDTETASGDPRRK